MVDNIHWGRWDPKCGLQAWKWPLPTEPPPLPVTVLLDSEAEVKQTQPFLESGRDFQKTFRTNRIKYRLKIRRAGFNRI